MNVAHDNRTNAEMPAARHSHEDSRPHQSSKEDWHERAKWEPTAEEFQSYLVREVAMAKVNISRGNPANSTLHSSATIALAQEELDRETGNEGL